MKLKYGWNIVNSVLILSLIGLIVFSFLNKRRDVVFIDNVRVFKEFNMTKELGKINEEKYKPELVAYDSLVKAITNLETSINKSEGETNNKTEKYVKLKRKISIKENELEAIRTYVKKEINKKVWSRLNGYVKEFGEEKKVDLIVGAQGSGNIMYGADDIDYTDEFINYANLKYEGN
ncbi:hypothetical protein KUL156_57970 [Alteromonas sp. KUL156]|nr:hypothetical protein KUL154_03020 [Alteromonas sp. KUL154]GFE03205.1 hypothetical protein KUL156_57970 [Alteromonas sp. KUL156]